jgi:nitrate/TMAO reductase-like tetraheme cytochrome c subunit
MKPMPRSRALARLFNYANNAISLLGVVLTTLSAIMIVVFVISESMGAIRNPYVGMFAFIALPSLFVVGLLLIPLGMWRRKRRLLAAGTSDEEMATYPRLDFNDPLLRRAGAIVIGFTALNGIILGASSYMAVETMDKVEFCGTTCHTVMQPEYSAYQGSAHSRVQCVQCHIGPGASFFVRSKVDGLRQVWKVALDSYERPIPTPVANLRPARETCETCHWPSKHYGDKLRVFARFSSDEASTPSYTAMLLKTGGDAARGGIHGVHLNAGNRVRYVAGDEQRQEISWVEFTNAKGEAVVYTKDGKPAPSAAEIAASARTMDCIDCHNRPTHLFETPSKALDAVIERDLELRDLPFFKKESLAAVSATYATHDEGVAAVQAAIETYYRTSYPQLVSDQAALVTRAATAAAAVYGRTVFPEMKTNWETHPNNIGHEDFPGCWRCHGGDMQTADGERYIPQDCDTCHNILTEGERTAPDLAALVSGHAAGG